MIAIIGNKFNRLTVISQEPNKVFPSGTQVKMWKCLCECGNLIVTEGRRLKNGTTKSCGCLNMERRIDAINKYNASINNTFDLTGQYGIGYTTKGEEFYFDKEDYEKIKNHTWSKKSDGYLHARIENNLITLHKYLFPAYRFVDHINHNKADNRRCNLREVTKSQNAMNRKNQSNSTTGVTGVVWNKCNQKWRSRITVNNKRIELGSYCNFEDAVKARKNAEEKYFGEYSYDNSLKKAGAK